MGTNKTMTGTARRGQDLEENETKRRKLDEKERQRE